MLEKTITWNIRRLAEPSSYAAIGVAVMGVGVVINQPVLAFIGIIGGVLGFILKEKGVI